MKLISDLKVGDKIFVINHHYCTLNIAEVISVLNAVIILQFYFNDTSDDTYCIWKYQESKHIAPWYTFFTDEIEALEEFRRILKWQE